MCQETQKNKWQIPKREKTDIKQCFLVFFLLLTVLLVSVHVIPTAAMAGRRMSPKGEAITSLNPNPIPTLQPYHQPPHPMSCKEEQCPSPISDRSAALVWSGIHIPLPPSNFFLSQPSKPASLTIIPPLLSSSPIIIHPLLSHPSPTLIHPLLSSTPYDPDSHFL